MCGRYALGIRASFVRHQFQEHDMPVDDAPEDDDVRQTYNFAPGSHGLVYRADVPDWGAGGRSRASQHPAGDPTSADQDEHEGDVEDPKETRYKLQAMKWGLVPFWTKRSPDYGSVMRTINARDDSLAQSGGMWNTMKQKKRCIVVAQGFYEWLKKNGGKEKIPHFTKRKDGQLMCFAGLWDCVQYEGMLLNPSQSLANHVQGSDEKHYTYTIITTDSNQQLSFLHDRMPVILDNGSESIRTWLEPKLSEWSKELQSLLKPYDGELECYPVSKEVGKVGNNSPTFIVPVASTENKSNIANFFSNANKAAAGKEEKKEIKAEESEVFQKGVKVEHDQLEKRKTVEHSSTEDNAPLPIPSPLSPTIGSKRAHGIDANEDEGSRAKAVKVADPSAPAAPTTSPEKRTGRNSRSSTSNGTRGSPAKSGDGSQRITNFFNK
ncbi:MAG: hypothetical protein LQ345_004455 [Seirophora villosa]|nr:MAG: hypothetical protein LQ345_004455 [Seirophora villosa]